MRSFESKLQAMGWRGRTVAMLLCLATAPVAASCSCDSDQAAGDAATGGLTLDAASVPERAHGPSPWPPLPADEMALDQLIARHSHRPAKAGRASIHDIGPEPSADDLLALLRGRFRDGSVVGGYPLITRRLEQRLGLAHREGRGAFLLWGVYHDSARQLAAFRRLTGPLGFSGRLTIAAELFDADGRWAAVPADGQRGDDELLQRYFADGEPAAFHQLLSRQREGNYTAWKFGYLDGVMDLLVSARASGRPLLGCDMPGALQRRARETLSHRTEQLRELHCALALRDAMGTDMARTPVAILWGQAHLGADGFERYLPKDAEVVSVRVFGARPGAAGVARPLGKRLALAAPVLLPTDELGRRLALLLPGRHLSARVDRVHDGKHCALPTEQRQRLRLSSTAPGLFHVRDAKVDLDADARSVLLPAGDHTFLFEADERVMAGALTMPTGGQVDLDLGPDERTILVTVRSCTRGGAAPHPVPTSAASRAPPK